MLKKFNSVKLIKTLIKLAAVMLTSPATATVAGSLYPAHPLTKVVVSIAALILVEGCLLLGWEMLDQEGKHATATQRWFYAGLAWVAYFALFGIALHHHEGGAGLAFRLTLGVMLVYASAEAGLLANIKIKNRRDKDITKDRRVQRYARSLARKAAMADLDSNSQKQQVDREAEEMLYTLRKVRETEEQLALLEYSGTPKGVEMAKLDTQSTDSLEKANRQRNRSKQQAMRDTYQILKANPDTRPIEIAQQIRKSRQTVYDYLKELEQQGKIHRNGSGIKIAN